MLVSIIITNHNYCDYLGYAIDSALCQSYKHKEIIVVDDGSTDGSIKLIKSYGGRINSLLKDRGGHCSAVNAGFRISHGEIIFFLDADDYLLDHAIESLVSPHIKDKSVVKSQGYLSVVNRDGEPMGQRIPRKFDPPGNYCEEALLCGLHIFRHTYTSGNAWARSFLECVTPLPENRHVGADGLLNSVSPLFGNLSNVDRAVAAYRVHGHNNGPVGTTFSFESLKKRVDEQESNREFLVSWANALGYSVPNDSWQSSNWHHVLRAHSLGLMNETYPNQRFNDLILSPFRTLRTNPVKRSGVFLLLSILWCLPRRAALTMARNMLKLPKL